MRRFNYKRNKQTSTQNVQVKRKCVRFAVTSRGNIMRDSRKCQHSLDTAIWFNQEECSHIRRSAQSVVESIQQGDVIWSEARRQSYVKTMTKVWRSCAKGKNLSDSMIKELRFWTGIGHSRRGLETHSLPEVTRDRQSHRSDLVDAVMFVQERCSENAVDYDQTAHLLRVASEKFSKATKNFAVVLAAADAYAVKNNHVEEQLVQDMMKKLLITRACLPFGDPGTERTPLLANGAA